MVGVSVVQVANAVRHTPLLSLASDADPGLRAEDPIKRLDTPASPLHVLGGFVGGGQLAWRAAGPTVEIIEPDRGTRKAAWTFGAVLHNSDAQVGLGTICWAELFHLPTNCSLRGVLGTWFVFLF